MRASRSRTAFRDALDEHAQHGLPEIADVSAVLDGLGVTYRVRPQTTVAEWLSSFVFSPNDWEEPELVLGYWAFLNQNTPDGAMVTRKDPMEFLRRLRFHRWARNEHSYGL